MLLLPLLLLPLLPLLLLRSLRSWVDTLPPTVSRKPSERFSIATRTSTDRKRAACLPAPKTSLGRLARYPSAKGRRRARDLQCRASLQEGTLAPAVGPSGSRSRGPLQIVSDRTLVHALGGDAAAVEGHVHVTVSAMNSEESELLVIPTRMPEPQAGEQRGGEAVARTPPRPSQ